MLRGQRAQALTPGLREKVAAVLGEVPGQGIVYRQGGLVESESSCIREQARARGLNLKDLAGLVGVSASYMTDVSRGRRNMSPSLQARVESVLGGPVEIAGAEFANRQYGTVKGQTTWIRERARELGLSMRELADQVGVSVSYISQVARACGTWARRSRQEWRPRWEVRSESRRPSGPSSTRRRCGPGWRPTE